MDVPTPTIPAELSAEWQILESDPRLMDEANFCARAEAIDVLEFYFLENYALPIQLLDGARVLHRNLLQIDQQLFQKLKAQLRTTRDIRSLTNTYIDIPTLDLGAEYDNLDLFINRLLAPTTGEPWRTAEPGERGLPQPLLPLEPDMVYFQKTPARVIFYLADLLHPKSDHRLDIGSESEHFLDIGAGLGQVVILFALLTGIPSEGIDIEPAFRHYAQTSAEELGLTHSNFLVADARSADFSKATIFFLYTPFKGQMLAEILGRLQREAAQRTITLITYGPITETFQNLPWLRPLVALTNAPESLGLFSSGAESP
jgi:hypothetical protein